MKKLLSILLILTLIFTSILLTSCTQIQNIFEEKLLKNRTGIREPDSTENNNNNNNSTSNNSNENSNNENPSKPPKTEVKTVRIFAFDYETPELYYYDTEITVTDNALVTALTNELQYRFA